MKLIDKDALVAEIEKLKLYTMDEHMKFYSECAEAEYNALCKVEEIIDSLQEENVDKVPYDKLSKMLDESLAKETKESWEEFLGAYKCNIVPKPIECDSNCRDCSWSVKPEKPVSEELEEAAMQYAKLKHKDATLQKIVSWDFKAGAKWQKEQMMSQAIDGLVICDKELTQGYKDIVFSMPKELKVDDKVKMIIVKED